MHRQTVREIANGFSFLEGPRWRDGRVYASDFYGRQVVTITLEGDVEVLCDVPGQPSGLGFAPNGDLLISSMTDRRLLRCHDGAVTLEAELGHLAPGWCNDLLVDADGAAFIGNFGWVPAPHAQIRPTGLILVEPGAAPRIVAQGLLFPNAMVLLPGPVLLVAETFASRISAFDVAADKSLHNRRTWAEFSPRRPETIEDAIDVGDLLPDGMALDPAGRVWVADANGSGAHCVAPGGEILETIPAPDGMAIYSVGLGGADGRTLLMCAAPRMLTSNPPLERRSVLLAAQLGPPTAPSRHNGERRHDSA